MVEPPPPIDFLSLCSRSRSGSPRKRHPASPRGAPSEGEEGIARGKESEEDAARRRSRSEPRGGGKEGEERDTSISEDCQPHISRGNELLSVL